MGLVPPSDQHSYGVGSSVGQGLSRPNFLNHDTGGRLPQQQSGGQQQQQFFLQNRPLLSPGGLKVPQVIANHFGTTLASVRKRTSSLPNKSRLEQESVLSKTALQFIDGVIRLTYSAGGEHGPDRDADAAQGARQPHEVHQQEQAELESPQTVGAEEAADDGGGGEADDDNTEEAEEEAAEQVS